MFVNHHIPDSDVMIILDDNRVYAMQAYIK